MRVIVYIDIFYVALTLRDHQFATVSPLTRVFYKFTERRHLTHSLTGTFTVARLVLPHDATVRLSTIVLNWLYYRETVGVVIAVKWDNISINTRVPGRHRSASKLAAQYSL